MKKTLIIALFVAALVMSACGAGSPEAEVKATFEKFVDALKKGDLATLKSVAADEELANLPTDDATVKMAAAMMQAFEFSISDIKIDGDTATATITMKGEMMGQKMDESYPGKFKKVDGKWLIAKMQEK